VEKGQLEIITNNLISFVTNFIGQHGWANFTYLRRYTRHQRLRQCHCVRCYFTYTYIKHTHPNNNHYYRMTITVYGQYNSIDIIDTTSF